MSRQSSLKVAKVFVVTLAALAALVFSTAARMQAKKPISRQGLVNAVKINGLTTQELVGQIERRGVDFQMTADAEQELQSVGARPEVIEAARSNYRPASVAPATSYTNTPSRPANTTPATNANVPDRTPLSKGERSEERRVGKEGRS